MAKALVAILTCWDLPTCGQGSQSTRKPGQGLSIAVSQHAGVHRLTGRVWVFGHVPGPFQMSCERRIHIRPPAHTSNGSVPNVVSARRGGAHAWGSWQ